MRMCNPADKRVRMKFCRVLWNFRPASVSDKLTLLTFKNMSRNCSVTSSVYSRLLITLVVVFGGACFGASVWADQVIIHSDPETSVSLSEDVECSACDGELTPSAIEVLTGGSGGEVTAGQLWKFFKAQGVDSMDELTLHLDIDRENAASSADGSSIDISMLQFQIENPSGMQGFATDVNIGDKQVLLPTQSADPDVADMQLAVKLHYDFMERFSADSKEKIKLNVSGSGLMPSISIARKSESLRELSWATLVGFTVFWFGVFGLVNWLTKPTPVGTTLTQKSVVGS